MKRLWAGIAAFWLFAAAATVPAFVAEADGPEIFPAPNTGALQSAPPIGLPYNVHFRVSEDLVNRLLARRQVEVSPVRDYILEAEVFGRQETLTMLSVDFRPNDALAEVEFLLTGVTESSTVGITPQAAVNTLGRHQFLVAKPVYFDAVQFSTKTAKAHVAARNFNWAAATPAGNMPVIGRIANRFVLRAAEERRPLAEAIAAERLTEKAVPEFNRNLDEQLAAGNARWESAVRAPLKKLDFLPTRQRIVTTDSDLCYGGHFGSEHDARVIGPPPELASRPLAMSLAIHESLLNAFLDRLDLQGQSRAEHELIDAGEQFFNRLRKSDAESSAGSSDQHSPEATPGDQPLPAITILFDKTDPVRIRFAGDSVVVTLRAGFQLPVGGPIPPQRITIPFHVKQEDEEWLWEPGTIEVIPAEPPAIPDPLMLMQSLIRQRVAERLKPVRFRRALPLSLSGMNPLTVVTREIVVRDGWLAIGVEASQSPGQPGRSIR
jgi:hypothetical protein